MKKRYKVYFFAEVLFILVLVFSPLVVKEISKKINQLKIERENQELTIIEEIEEIEEIETEIDIETNKSLLDIIEEIQNKKQVKYSSIFFSNNNIYYTLKFKDKRVITNMTELNYEFRSFDKMKSVLEKVIKTLD